MKLSAADTLLEQLQLRNANPTVLDEVLKRSWNDGDQAFDRSLWLSSQAQITSLVVNVQL